MVRTPFQWVALIPGSWMTALATLGPLGRRMRAPGTVGSSVGLAWYAVMFSGVAPMRYIVLLAVTSYAAMAICEGAERHLGQRDPPSVILDEMIALPVCFIGLEKAFAIYPPWMIGVVAFSLFRIFDILKPFGIDKLQKLPGGIGIVADDLAAAGITCLCLHLLWRGLS